MSNSTRRARDSAITPRPNARVDALFRTNPVHISAAPWAAHATVIHTPVSCSGTAMVRKMMDMGRETTASSRGAPSRLIEIKVIRA